MSTKTTFKRIALVAVASLGLGVLTSVAPANAAVFGDTLTVSSATTTAAVSETATVTVSSAFLPTAANDAVVLTAFITSAPTGNAVTPVFSQTTAQSSGTGAANSVNTANNVTAAASTVTATTTAVAANLAAKADYTLSLVNLQVAGTYVIRVISNVTTTAPVTWTVTVTAPAALTADASS